jgi:signal transduction histidine kinase
MTDIVSISNLDLLAIGVAVAAIGLLGFVVFFNNPSSITNRLFLVLSIATIFWGISNYLEYKFTSSTSTLWALRTHLFISTWHALAFFSLAYVFPLERTKFPKFITYCILPITLITAVLTYTPVVFSGITSLAPIGHVTNPERGFGIVIFSIVAFGLLISGIIVLIRKAIKFKGLEKKQIISFLIGMLLMACLILLFNVVLPVALNNLSFIPYAALFVLPFIALTSYAIYRHHLFNIKVAAIAFVAFILSVLSFFNVIYATGLSQIVFNVTYFAAILLGSIILIRSVLREIEQREKIEKLADDLEKANVRLTELDRQKSEFVSFATHQLRAPLTAMKGYASLILEGDMGTVSAEAKKGIERIFDSTQTLIAIVNDYLNISRIELGSMKYAFETIDLHSLIDDVTEELRPNITASGLKFNVEAENHGTDYRITADRDKLKQVFANVIDNSLKYTPSGSVNVKLSYNRVAHKFVVTVTDTGIGIAPDVLPLLFRKFSRADNANRTNIRGTGLGLYVAKQMIEAHHGTIRAESAGEGKGTTFTIELEPLENL